MYKPIRIALKSLWREFRRASTMYPSLFHERYYFCTPQAEGEMELDPFNDKQVMANPFQDTPLFLADGYWSAFIEANKVNNGSYSSTVSLACSDASSWCISTFQRNESAERRRIDGATFSNPAG